MLGTLTVLDFGVVTSRARYSGLTAAHSSALEPCAAERWIAAGDASLSFDPLSAQGLLHAPFTGLAAAEAADAYLPATAKRRPEGWDSRIFQAQDGYDRRDSMPPVVPVD
jgi:flavin-dependent dehydrogenase